MWHVHLFFFFHSFPPLYLGCWQGATLLSEDILLGKGTFIGKMMNEEPWDFE
jgi:hypothetical protein